MTRMLASVANATEADVVLRHGADIVDLKDPGHGALGAVPLEAALDAVRSVARRRETSATLGDPPYNEEVLIARARALAAMGVDYLKLSVDRTTLESLGDAIRLLSREVAIVGVMFADEGAEFALLPDLAALGFKAVMLDTRDKSSGRLLDHLDVARLGDFCSQSSRLGLMSGLAGSLEGPDVPRLLLVRPDVMGFRKALCNARQRANAIDPQAVTLIRHLIPREVIEADASSKIDWRLLARGIVGGHDADGEVDRVFVHDFVVPARIGAYDFERHAEQRVVFDVEASVRRASAHADDMRSIFSYDIILDAIRLVIDRGHVDFIETLAEEVAKMVLGHPRVQSVRVNLQKLDVIQGSVGVEIRRDRPASIADARSLGLVAEAPKPAKD